MVDFTDAYPVQLHPFSNPDKQQVHGVGDVPGFSEKLQRKGGQFFISAQIAAADTVDQQFVRVQAGQPAAQLIRGIQITCLLYTSRFRDAP